MYEVGENKRSTRKKVHEHFPFFLLTLFNILIKKKFHLKFIVAGQHDHEKSHLKTNKSKKKK